MYELGSISQTSPKAPPLLNSSVAPVLVLSPVSLNYLKMKTNSNRVEENKD